MSIYSLPFITELIKMSVIRQNPAEVSKASTNFYSYKIKNRVFHWYTNYPVILLIVERIPLKLEAKSFFPLHSRTWVKYQHLTLLLCGLHQLLRGSCLTDNSPNNCYAQDSVKCGKSTIKISYWVKHASLHVLFHFTWRWVYAETA